MALFKLFPQLKLSSSTKSNLIIVFEYVCPQCKVKDNYLCLNEDDLTWCRKCNSPIYFQEMFYTKSEDYCKKLYEIVIGSIRTESDNNLVDEAIEKQLLLSLKEKFEKTESGPLP